MGLTQSELATMAGVSQPFLAQMEGAERIGTVGVLSRIARSLGVRIDDLVLDEAANGDVTPNGDTHPST